MPIPITCDVCGSSYKLKDEYAGRRVKCPKCENLIDVPAEVVEEFVVEEEEPEFPEELHDAFRRDKFLLRQKLWAIKEKYRVSDEDGETILYVERPVYFVAGCLATFVGLGIIAAAVFGALFVAEEVLLEVKQEQKFAFINFWYTLTDGEGEVIVRFRKNFLHGLLRKRWYIHAPSGEILFEVKEDSIILSLLRRTIGSIAEEIPLLGLALAAALRTNFVFTRYGETKVRGEFNRRLTLLDRYVLDLTDDPRREIDRRAAVAMGVLLDTGERR